jgi:hypothetical protein
MLNFRKLARGGFFVETGITEDSSWPNDQDPCEHYILHITCVMIGAIVARIYYKILTIDKFSVSDVQEFIA